MAFSSYAGCASHCLPPRVLTDVAVSLTALATIARRARRRGFWSRRGFAPESAAARICREAGGRVATNTHVRDLDVPVPANDGRRLEVVVDGPPFYGVAQTAVDTTLCYGFALRWLSSARGSGVPLDEARRRKERTYPELVQPRSSRKVGGDCWRSWRKMVQRSSLIHQALGQGTRSRVTRGF